MLSLLRSPSRSAGTAIWYVTVGVLMMIWTGVWYYARHQNWAEGSADGSDHALEKYVCIGLFMTGLAVLVIGLLVGQIGGAAKQADNTVGVAGQVVQPGMVAPGQVVQPGMVQPGTVQQVPTNVIQ